MRDDIESLWGKFYHLANKGFKERMLDTPEKFKQYLWEIYMGIFLINKKIKVKTNSRNQGPDFNFEYNNKNVYVECIAPTQGEEFDKNGKVRTNYLPSIKFDMVDTIPIQEAKKRILNAIQEKANKYDEYEKNNIIKTPILEQNFFRFDFSKSFFVVTNTLAAGYNCKNSAPNCSTIWFGTTNIGLLQSPSRFDSIAAATISNVFPAPTS